MFARLTAAEHRATPTRSGRIVADGLNTLWRWQDVDVRRPSAYVETEYGSCIVYDLKGDEEADAFIERFGGEIETALPGLQSQYGGVAKDLKNLVLREVAHLRGLGDLGLLEPGSAVMVAARFNSTVLPVDGYMHPSSFEEIMIQKGLAETGADSINLRDGGAKAVKDDMGRIIFYLLGSPEPVCEEAPRCLMRRAMKNGTLTESVGACHWTAEAYELLISFAVTHEDNWDRWDGCVPLLAAIGETRSPRSCLEAYRKLREADPTLPVLTSIYSRWNPRNQGGSAAFVDSYWSPRQDLRAFVDNYWSPAAEAMLRELVGTGKSYDFCSERILEEKKEWHTPEACRKKFWGFVTFADRAASPRPDGATLADVLVDAPTLPIVFDTPPTPVYAPPGFTAVSAPPDFTLCRELHEAVAAAREAEAAVAPAAAPPPVVVAPAVARKAAPLAPDALKAAPLVLDAIKAAQRERRGERRDALKKQAEEILAIVPRVSLRSFRCSKIVCVTGHPGMTNGEPVTQPSFEHVLSQLGGATVAKHMTGRVQILFVGDAGYASDKIVAAHRSDTTTLVRTCDVLELIQPGDVDEAWRRYRLALSAPLYIDDTFTLDSLRGRTVYITGKLGRYDKKEPLAQLFSGTYGATLILNGDYAKADLLVEGTLAQSDDSNALDDAQIRQIPVVSAGRLLALGFGQTPAAPPRSPFGPHNGGGGAKAIAAPSKKRTPAVKAIAAPSKKRTKKRTPAVEAIAAPSKKHLAALVALLPTAAWPEPAAPA